MNKRQKVNGLVYFFLCFSVLLIGFPGIMAEARDLPVGEMISQGEVRYEARDSWKSVESSNFPVFQGTKIKTDKGAATLTLSNNTQIEVDQKSLFSFDRPDRLVLTQGSIRFRIPSTSETTFKAGSIVVGSSRALQAGKNPVAAKVEEAIGSISINANGALTIKSIQGKLSVLNQNQVVLASLSSAESVTIPSVSAGAASGGKASVADVVGSGAKEVGVVSSGFTIASQTEGPKGEGTASALSGGMSTIRQRLREAVCP